MPSKIERQAADLAFGTPYALTTVTTAARLEVPADMAERFCFFQAITSDVYIRFGGDSVTVDEAARSAVASMVLTADGDEPHIHVVAGTTVHHRMKAAWTHFAHKSSGTSGVLRFGSSQGAAGTD